MDAMGLRLARRPATVRGGAVVFLVDGGRATAASGVRDESAIVEEEIETAVRYSGGEGGRRDEHGEERRLRI